MAAMFHCVVFARDGDNYLSTPWKVVRSTFQMLVSLYNLLVEEGFFHPILSIFVFSFTGNQLGAVLAVLG